MQLGFVSAILDDLSFEEVLEFAADEGYDCVEVMCWPQAQAERKYAGVTHIDVADFTKARGDDTRALGERFGVALSGLGYYPNPLSGNTDEAQLARAHLRRVMDAAALLAPIPQFRNRLFHTHAKDMKIERELLNAKGVLALGWATPKIPGLGDIDWHRWISALTDAGYDGPVCVEVEDEAFTGTLESRKTSLRISRNVLRPLIP